MKSVKRCSTCSGQKQVLSLGGLFKKCSGCNGIGYTERVADEDVDSFLAEKPKAKPQKVKPSKAKPQSREAANVTAA